MNKKTIFTIFIIIILAMFFGTVGVYLYNKALETSVRKTGVSINTSAGIPITTDKKFKEQGWTQIPELGILADKAAREDGGEIVGVKTLVYSGVTYAKVTNASDNGTFNYYYLLRNNAWTSTTADKLPAVIKSIFTK